MRKYQSIYLLVLLCAVVLCSCSSSRYAAYVVNYPSVDQNGNPLILSGKVTVPTKKQPRGVMLIPHYTITGNSEAPSMAEKGEQQSFREDYVLVLPDLIGYGITRDSVHPYLRGDLTAQNCVDMLPAAQHIIDSLHLPASCDSLTIVGFSQGGATALWVMQLLETQYADRYRVQRCFAGSGPYDVAATFDEAVMSGRVGAPVVIPMLVLGTSAAYGLNLKHEQFFTPRMDEIYNLYVTNKEYAFSKVFFKMTNHDVSHWLTGYGMDKTQPETQRLYEGLLRSSLVHYPLDSLEIGAEIICPEWQPKAPVYVFHSTKDRIVTFHCAEHLQRCWQGLPNVTFNFGNYGSHLRSAYTFMPKVKKILDEQSAIIEKK